VDSFYVTLLAFIDNTMCQIRWKFTKKSKIFGLHFCRRGVDGGATY